MMHGPVNVKYILTYVHTHIHVHAYIHIRTIIHTNTYIHTYIKHTQTYIHAYIHTHTHTHNWGLSHKALKTIYVGGILPLPLYGAPVWTGAMKKINIKIR